MDLVYAAPDHEFLARRMESRSGIHTLENAEAIGPGSRNYQLADIGQQSIAEEIIMSKKLVVYFSASGVTARAAKALAEAAGADLYEIKPKVPYTGADLDWMNKKSRSSVEMSDPASRPELADTGADVAGADVIFVGFPVWWYTAPAIIKTFLETYDFSGRTVVPFATSGGSGLGNTAETLRELVPGATVRSGKMLNGRPSTAELKKWADQFE